MMIVSFSIRFRIETFVVCMWKAILMERIEQSEERKVNSCGQSEFPVIGSTIWNENVKEIKLNFFFNVVRSNMLAVC